LPSGGVDEAGWHHWLVSADENVGQVGRSEADSVTAEQIVRANRDWWDGDADTYHDEHGDFLGVADFVWCPERLREEDAQLLGPTPALVGQPVLEVGAGSAMCSRWLAARGARAVALDLSAGMLDHGRQGNSATGTDVALVQADARRLPFRDDSFAIAFTAFGAIPFVADATAVMHEVSRVVRPGGRWVFATTHPMRWAFPDDPGPRGLTATMSYFDRSPYLEFGDDGELAYAEYHRTFGDRVRELREAGFVIDDVIEPEWPAGLTEQWGQWSPLRGAHFPGTVIFSCTNARRPLRP
jgi:SAM-dependent methyltransferase